MSKPFIHLRCLSSYSLSESTLKIKKLVSLAKKNNLPALAITDNNNISLLYVTHNQKYADMANNKYEFKNKKLILK